MKKILIALVLGIILISCQGTSASNNEKIVDRITYFKDPKTGLCFAAINSDTYGFNKVTSITYVPCDSLKKLGIK